MKSFVKNSFFVCYSWISFIFLMIFNMTCWLIDSSNFVTCMWPIRKEEKFYFFRKQKYLLICQSNKPLWNYPHPWIQMVSIYTRESSSTHFCLAKKIIWRWKFDCTLLECKYMILSTFSFSISNFCQLSGTHLKEDKGCSFLSCNSALPNFSLSSSCFGFVSGV